MFDKFDYKLKIINWYISTKLKEEKAIGSDKHRYALIKEAIEDEFPLLIKDYKDDGKDE